MHFHFVRKSQTQESDIVNVQQCNSMHFVTTITNIVLRKGSSINAIMQ